MATERRLIVVVDDSPYVRELYEAILEGVAEVHAYEGVRQALGEVGEADLVVTDLSMPEENGLVLVDYMKSRHPATPVLVVTGSDRGTLEFDEARRRGVPLIQKPFGLHAFRQAVHVALFGPTPCA